MVKRVSIFGCGVQKGGTTSLHAHFCEHPRLSPPSRKETHFFDDETQDWSAPDYTKLDAFYRADDSDRARFDITPIYAFWPPSLARIRAYNPDARLIFLFRDPFERAWSQWCMEYARGLESLPFAEAIRGGRRRMEGLPPLADAWRVHSYVERGFYAAQTRRALEFFPPEQLLFLRSADLATQHVQVLERIAGFLEIGAFPHADAGPKREHGRPDFAFPSEPTESDREYLNGLMREDLQEFASLTGLDVSGWLETQARGDASQTAKATYSGSNNFSTT